MVVSATTLSIAAIDDSVSCSKRMKEILIGTPEPPVETSLIGTLRIVKLPAVVHATHVCVSTSAPNP